MNSMRPQLSHGTVCVPSINVALSHYVDLFEQRVIDQGAVSEEEAASWCAPSTVGAPFTVLQPPSDAPVYLRLIEQDHPGEYHPGTHYGWSALELSVASADKMHARYLQANIPVIAPPKPLSFTDMLYPMQARGPGGEAIYLNEVRGNLPGSDIPVAACWVDKLFIAVMGCRDRQTSLNFYNKLLGSVTAETWEIEYRVINAAFGFPVGTRHKLSTIADGRTVLFEVDQYPDIATSRPQAPGYLPPGICNIGVRLSAAPANQNWITPPMPRQHAPYFGATVGVVQGPDGELTELLW